MKYEELTRSQQVDVTAHLALAATQPQYECVFFNCRIVIDKEDRGRLRDLAATLVARTATTHDIDIRRIATFHAAVIGGKVRVSQEAIRFAEELMLRHVQKKEVQ